MNPPPFWTSCARRLLRGVQSPAAKVQPETLHPAAFCAQPPPSAEEDETSRSNVLPWQDETHMSQQKTSPVTLTSTYTNLHMCPDSEKPIYTTCNENDRLMRRPHDKEDKTFYPFRKYVQTRSATSRGTRLRRLNAANTRRAVRSSEPVWLQRVWSTGEEAFPSDSVSADGASAQQPHRVVSVGASVRDEYI